MPSRVDTAGICAALAPTGTVLLPTSFAARAVRSRWADLPGTADLAPPLAWDEWTASLWPSLLLEGQEDRLVLNRLQEEQLWLRVLDQSPTTQDMPRTTVEDLAAMARSGLQWAAAHQVTAQLGSTHDGRVLAEWVAGLLAHCGRERLLVPALLPDALAAHLRAGRWTPPLTLHLVGFEQLLPAQQRLLEGLENSGTTIRMHSLQADLTAPHQRLCAVLPDGPTQLRAAVQLIVDHARQLPKDKPRIALVLPDPSSHRPELERLFREVLAPELALADADLSSTPWQFNPAAPLGQSPLIAAALDILEWGAGPQPLARVRQLLRSPFFASADLPEARARFDLDRAAAAAPAAHTLRGSLSLHAFAQLRRQPQGTFQDQDHTPELFAEFVALVPTARAWTSGVKRTAADWADAVRSFLRLAGWPGARPLSAAEFRTLQSWEGLLDQLATLQFDGSRLTFRAFLQKLRREAESSPTLAAAPDAPVQVLSLAETEGFVFDLAIHLDATDRNLPTRSRRHPLVSQSLQNSLGVGDPARDTLHGEQQLAGLAARTGTLYLLAAREAGEDDVQLTSLAGRLGFQPVDLGARLPPEAQGPTVSTEPVDDAEVSPLPPMDTVHGGVHVLKLQAACGFSAFATYRLHAKDDVPQQLGLDARFSGQLLHEVFRSLWDRLGSHAALASLTPDERRTWVETAVHDTFRRQRLRADPEDPWTTEYLKLAQSRFVRLVLHWLLFELERSPFTVLAQESDQVLQLGPIRLKIRPDRIDETEDGLILVDYKTQSSLSVDHWLEARPEAPQLPAYALAAADKPLQGIAFARVRPGSDMRWISLSDAGVFPKTGNRAANFEEHLDFWYRELLGLAEAFAQGVAQVNPKEHPETCRNCGHRTLCRLDPATLLTGAEDSLDPEEDGLG